MDGRVVVGLDLETMREVHVDDRPTWEWRLKGHNGDGSLVCLSCYDGVDVPTPRKVPLIPRGRVGGRNRAHFAHPAGTALQGASARESERHARGKAALRQWALGLPNVASAVVEHCTADGRRRSDVSVVLTNGQRIALEVQLQVIIDAEWLARHHDYQRTNVADVWIWGDPPSPPDVLYTENQPGWILSPTLDGITAVYGLADEATGAWWEDADLARYADRWPPRPNDNEGRHYFDLEELTLTEHGLMPPEAFRRSFDEHVQEVRQAASIQAAAHRQRRERRSPTPRPTAAPPEPSKPTRMGSACPYRTHDIQLISARPPWEEPRDDNLFYCPACGNITRSRAVADPRHGLQESHVPHDQAS